MHACAFDWPKQTFKIYFKILHISPVTMTCAEAQLCCQTTLRHIWGLDACMHIWLAGTNSQNWCCFLHIFPQGENDFWRAMPPDYLGTFSSTLCQIWSLEEAILWQQHISKMHMGIVNVLFCSIFVPFHFFLLWHWLSHL